MFFKAALTTLKRAQPVATPAPARSLPRTATDAELIAGVILLTVSLTLLVFNRRRLKGRGLTPS